MLNPRPLFPFFDILLIGEAEAILNNTDWIFEEKQTIKDALTTKEYSLIPGEKETAKRAYLNDLSTSKAFSAILSEKSLFNMFLIEIQRGCPSKCRFCFLGHSYLPPRFMPQNVIKYLLKHGERHTKNMGFVGSAILSHPDIREILEDTLSIYTSISFSSMSLYDLISKPYLIPLLKKGGVKTITVAPETGPQLRKKINKPYKDEEIYQLIDLIQKHKIMSLKLYFMIGLPEEEVTNIEEIISILEKVLKIYKGSVKVTISIFVPKFHTPLADTKFANEREIKEKIKILKKLSPKKRLHLQLPSYHHAKREALLARADERVGIALYKKVYLHESIRQNIDIDEYLFSQSTISKLILKHPVNTGVKKVFMEQEYNKYHKAIITPQCKPKFCRLCGLCSK